MKKKPAEFVAETGTNSAKGEVLAVLFAAVEDWTAAMAAVPDNEILHVLLVENSSERSELVNQSLREAGFACRIHRVADLMEALAYLREDFPYVNAPRPDFVVLGQSQEHVCCCELLSEIRRNPRCAGLETIGLKDTWWQNQPRGQAPIPFACCDLDRMDVAGLGESVNEAWSNLLRPCG